MVLVLGIALALFAARTGLWWSALASVGTLGILWLGSVWLVSSGGLFVSPLFPTLGVVLGFSGISLARFNVERRRGLITSQALRQAKTDVLTGMPNRRAFEEFFEDQFELANSRHPLSLLFADVDRFKQFNDIHGHAVGDRVLVAFSRTLQTTAAERGLVFRVGGEEFAIVCPDMTAQSAAELAEHLLHVVADQALVVEDSGRELSISCSIGLAHSYGRLVQPQGSDAQSSRTGDCMPRRQRGETAPGWPTARAETHLAQGMHL